MINPPRPPVSPRPHITDIGLPPQVFSPETKKEPPSNYASPLLPSKVLINYSVLNQYVFAKYLFLVLPILLLHALLHLHLHPPQQENHLLHED